ncbi:MAG TPA: hypothetical protein VNT81_09080 [Vicinamibacterales bacterium]|nr:hypothetical protein [Vicinamibacterales bacterium]
MAAMSTSTQRLFSDEGSSCSLFREVQVYATDLRIPDLVVVLHKSAGAPQQTLSYYEAAILHALTQHGPIAAPELASEMFCMPVEVAKRLDKLERQRLVVKLGSRYSLNARAFPIGVRVIAIEAKLREWKRAIKQACGYMSFANEAYIAMPERVVQRPQVLEACEAASIGILSVHDSGKVTLLHRPTPSAVMSAEYLRLLSATVGLNQRSQ